VRRNLKLGAYRLPPEAEAADAAGERSCPLCGRNDFTPRVAQGGFRMVECGGCKLWYLNPMPAHATLERLYGEAYFSGEAARLGYADYQAMAEDCRDTFRRRLTLVDRHVGAGRLLDVGAGFGYLADAAAPTFAERWVVELSEQAARRVSGAHRVVVGDWETVDVPRGYFDVVSLQDCLEHLPEPLAALEKIRSVLRPGGAVLAVTPNVRSWLARLQRRSWVSLKFPEHVVLYSDLTLRKALEAAGFRVETMVPAGQYARLDFLAARLTPGLPRFAARLEDLVRRAGGDRRRVYVPSGSIAAVATVP
jgi:SAM-dependent methyltransferase